MAAEAAPTRAILPAYNHRMLVTIASNIEWPVDVPSARAIQESLRARVVRENRLGPVTRVAGVDEVGRGPLAGPVVAAAVVLDPDTGEWVASHPKFLVPGSALRTVFRAKFRDALKTADPDLFAQAPPSTWNTTWAVHCKAVGDGRSALKYLTPYIYRVALSNRRLVSMKDGTVTFDDNLSFGDGNLQYYETICGGTGAGRDLEGRERGRAACRGRV